MKRQVYVGVAVLFLLGLCLPGAAFSSSVEEQISVLKKQMEQMQQKLGTLQAELEKAQGDATSAQQRAEQAAQQAEQKVTEVSGRLKTIDDLVRKFGHLKFNGYVRSRWWDGQDEQTSFDVTELALNVRYDVSENISGEFHLWWHPSQNAGDQGTFRRYRGWAGPTVFFESAFAEFRNLNIGPIQGKLIAGKARNWAFGITPTGRDRVTSDYGLFHRSMSQSRITGVQYLTTYSISETQKIKANFAVFNGWSIAGWGTTRNAGDVRTNNWKDGKATRLLRTGQLNIDDDNNKAYSMRFAYQPMKELEVGASFFRQKLSDNDLAAFNAVMGRNPGLIGNLLGNRSDDDEDMRWGFDVEYKKAGFHFQGQYFWGEISDVKCNWWYAMAGYTVRKFKTSFYLRYVQANYDQHRIADLTGSGAWDKEQITPLIIYHLHPRAKLFFEYYFNYENAPKGAHHVDDNYGFVELILFY